MGLSFHDDNSMEASVGSLYFVAADPNPTPEDGSIGIIDLDEEKQDTISDPVKWWPRILCDDELLLWFTMTSGSPPKGTGYENFECSHEINMSGSFR